MKTFFTTEKKNILFWIFCGIMAVLLFLMPILSKDAGMSGDEYLHIRHAENVVNFYKTLGEDTAAISTTGTNVTDNIYQYGQLPDNLAYLIDKMFGSDDVLAVRHVVNSLFGWICIFFAALLVYRVSNSWMAAIVAALLFFLSPRFLGHSFNNLKDVPFAATMMMGTYFIYRLLTTFPKPKITTCLMLALSIGMAIGVRVGGLLLIAYFGLFALAYLFYLHLMQRKPSKSVVKKKSIAQKQHVNKKVTSPTPVQTEKPVATQNLGSLFKKLVVYGLAITVVGYFIGVLVWPYAWVAPIAHVKEVFAGMSLFPVSIRQLFEGQLTMSSSLPWYYTPKYILMTVPVAVILGMIAYPFFGGLKKQNWFSTFVVYFAFIFPIFWIIYSNANVYGGWRHAIFAYPAIVIAAALGFNACVEWAKHKYLKIALQVLPFALLILPAAHIIRNHPYEYVYFNLPSGGIEKAYGNYELDYYYHSTRAATEWAIEDARKSGLPEGRKLEIATFHQPSVAYYVRNDSTQMKEAFARWRERSVLPWDYAVFTITGIAPQMLKSPHFPPANTVHTIKVDGKPICLVLKKTDNFAYQAAQLQQQMNDTAISNEQRMSLFGEALNKYKQALTNDPYDEIVLSALTDLYLSIGRTDSALLYADKLIEYFPTEDLLNYVSNVYLQLAQRTNNQQYVNHAIALQNQMITSSPRNSQNYYNLAMLYARTGNTTAGAKLMKDCLEKNARNFEANYYAGIYHAQTGNRNEAVAILEKCLDKFPSHTDEIQSVLNQINGAR